MGDDALITLEEYRTAMYAQHPGCQYITIGRDNFLERILGVYKDPRFDFNKKPKVEFIAEPGADIGALTLEYFYKGLISLTSDKLEGRGLFEGEKDRLVPSRDARLLRCGIFKTIGRFIAHSALHVGIGFIGLSDAIAEYLITESADSDTPFSLTIEDVPDHQIRQCLAKINEIERGASLGDIDAALVTSVATSCDFYETGGPLNARTAYEHIYNSVIDKKSRQLDAIKDGFKSSGLYDFIKNKKYLISGIFRKTIDIEYPVALLIEKLQSNIDHEIVNHVKEYINSLANDPESIRQLLRAWTGWALLPDSHLTIRIEDDIQFLSQACFNELSIPMAFTKADVFFHMNLLVNHASEGFGSV